MFNRSTRELRGLGIWLLTFSQVFMLAGCRQQGGRSGKQGGMGSTAPGATAGPNLGLILYNVLHHNLETTGTKPQVASLEADKQPFIDAVNHILPTSVSTNLFPTINKLLPLVDDDTIPDGMKDVEGMVNDLLASPDTIAALAAIMNGPKVQLSIDPKDGLRLVGKLLSHPEFDQLFKATNSLIKQKPDVLRNIQSLIARKLQGMTPNTFTGSPINLQGLASALLSEVDTGGLGDLGDPAWAVRLDKNGNPKVSLEPASGRILPPFVDDGSGAAAINADGKPVDAAGVEIAIKPFGTDGSRDSYGRALATGGLTLFEYFDAKKTLLSEVLILVGNLIRAGVPNDFETVIDKIAVRVNYPDPNDPWTGFQGDCPLVDLLTSGTELARRTPAPQLLEGLALMVKADPAGFEALVTELLIAINLASQSGFNSSGNQKMMDDLLPLVSAAAKQGNGASLRQLLRSFNTAQAQLSNLPKGFALMMKYHDFGKKILTAPGLPSEMERLLGIMDRSNGCNAPILGNLAVLYIDTMAGNNKSILGLKLDISTMNKLMGIGPLRSLLCSALNADDVGVLQDFVDTGSLDAFTPIAKAFSDQKQTQLLVDIMLALGKHYAAAMRPNEATVVKLLESGAVEKLFQAIDRMSKVKLPSNGAMLIDVLADTVAALVDDTKPIVDRHGRSHKTLLNAMSQPLIDLTNACQTAGVKDVLDRALGNIGGQLLATYTDSTGKTKLVYSGLISTLGETLNFLSAQIPADAAARNTWCDDQAKLMHDLFTGRDFAAIAEFLLAVNGSPDCDTFKAALAGLFTPQKNAAYDALGAILQLAAALIQHKPTAPMSPQLAQDMAKVMNFMGVEMDPKSGKTTRLLNMIIKITIADDGLLILKVVRNAIDMGPNGADEPPVMIIMSIMDKVKKAGPASTATTATDALTTQLNGMVKFMNDKQTGLPHFVELIKSRNKQ